MSGNVRLIGHSLVALVVAAGFVGHSVAFGGIVTGCWVLVLGCLALAGRPGRMGRALPGSATTDETAAARPWAVRAGWALLRNLVRTAPFYLLPMAVGVSFHVLLSAYVWVFGDSLSLGWLMTMQRGFEGASNFFSEHLALSPAQVLLLLVATYLLSCVLLSIGRRSPAAGHRPGGGRLLAARIRSVTALDAAMRGYLRFSGPLGAGLATLAAFTFFGMHLGDTAKDLRLRMKAIQTGYADVVQKLDRDVSEHVAAALYDKVFQSFPQSYQDALGLPDRIEASARSARSYADAVRSDYGVADPTLDRLLKNQDVHRKRVADLDSTWRIDGTPEGRIIPDADVTYDQVRAADEALERRHKKAIEIISEGPKKITLQVESLASGRILELTRPLVTNFPLLQPVLDAFSGAVDQTVQDGLGTLYDKVAEQAVRDPAHLDAAVERDARAVAARAEVSARVGQVSTQADRQVHTLTQTLATLDAAQSTLDGRVAETVDAEAGHQGTADDGKLLPLPEFPGLELPPLPDWPGLGYHPPSVPYEPPLPEAPHLPPTLPEGGGYHPPVFGEPFDVFIP